MDFVCDAYHPHMFVYDVVGSVYNTKMCPIQ